MDGEGPFYSCVSRRGNAGLCTERGREVMTQLDAAAEQAFPHAA
jgi:hypothetical protein